MPSFSWDRQLLKFLLFLFLAMFRTGYEKVVVEGHNTLNMCTTGTSERAAIVGGHPIRHRGEKESPVVKLPLTGLGGSRKPNSCASHM